MERFPKLLDKQDQRSKNGNPTKSNLQIQCIAHQNHNTIFHRPQKNNTQLHMEKQKNSILYNKGTSGDIIIHDFKVYYRAKIIKNSLVLA